MSPEIQHGEPKIPFVVKNLYGLTALSCLLTFPLIYVVYQAAERGDKLIHEWWHSVPIADPPLFPVVFIAFMMAFSITYLPGCAVASRYIVRLVRFHLERGDEKAAKQALLKYSNQLWYRDIRKNMWLLEFIVQRHLWEKAGRFARFSR